MAILPDVDRFRCWARIMRDVVFRALMPSDLAKSALRDAVNDADQWADDNAASFNAALPPLYRTSATTAQKTLLLAAVLMRRAGLFRTEEDG